MSEMKNWNEYLAKLIIEDFFPKWKPMEKYECPDLQGESVGFEVTCALPDFLMKTDGQRESLRADLIDAERYEGAGAFKVAQKLRDKVAMKEKKIGFPISKLPAVQYLPPDFFEQSKLAVAKGIKKKTNLLNNGNYDSFLEKVPKIGLFLWASVLFSEQESDENFWTDIVKAGTAGYLQKYDLYLAFCIPTSCLVHLSAAGEVVSAFHVNTWKYQNELDQLSRD